MPVLYEEFFKSRSAAPTTPGWRPAMLDRLLEADGAAARRRALQAQVQSLGFAWLGYGLFARLGERLLPQSYCVTCDDAGWVRRYFRAGYADVDLRLGAAWRSPLPRAWSLEGLERDTRAAAETAASPTCALAFLNELRATGARSGVMLALPAADGTFGAGDLPGHHAVSLVSRRPGSTWLTAAVLGDVLLLAMCLRELCPFSLGDVGAPASPAPEPDTPVLTPLQRAILEGVAGGLGDKQIASRLGLSASNVDYHLRQLRRRFGAHNRVQLVQAAQRAAGAGGPPALNANPTPR